MAKRLATGKGIRVRCCMGDGEIVSWVSHPQLNAGVRSYEIRLGPAHFVYLPRKEFEILDTIIKFDTLIKLRQTALHW